MIDLPSLSLGRGWSYSLSSPNSFRFATKSYDLKISLNVGKDSASVGFKFRF